MAGRWAKGLVEDRCSRRAFLRAAGATAALASFGTLGCLGTTGPAAGPAASVATPSTALRTGLVVAVDEDPARLVDRALDAFGGLSGIIKKGDRVVGQGELFLQEHTGVLKPAGCPRAHHAALLGRRGLQRDRRGLHDRRPGDVPGEERHQKCRRSGRFQGDRPEHARIHRYGRQRALR